MHASVPACMHITSIHMLHSYTHTCIHNYMHTYIHHIHTYIHTVVLITSMHTYITFRLWLYPPCAWVATASTMARPSKTEIAQKRTLRLRPRFCWQAQQFQHFYVCFVASRALLFSTGTAVYAIFCRALLSLFFAFVHQRGEQQWRREQRWKRTLRLRPHFCRQAKRFQ